ncbi:MAG: DUF5928 domain-containing protein [Pseudomonadota bacterium]
MAKIAFLLMAHKSPAEVIAQAMALTAHGDTVTIHYDRRAGQDGFDRIRAGLKGNPNVAFARRVRGGWGTWSLVQASLNMIRMAKRRFDGITHYYLISGDCYPTKSRSYIEQALAAAPETDFIEVNEFYESGWIRTGLREERLIYRHWFNEREQRWWFYTSMNLQRRLGWRRSPPADLSMRIGSQWWLLRARTVNRLLAHLKKRRDIRRFFRTTWIPDEIFFQTLVGTLVPAGEIRSAPPTHLIFSDYGMPVVFYRDHTGYLRCQDRLFARKLSPDAAEMRAEMLRIFAEDLSDPAEGTQQVPGRLPPLYAYLTGRGRDGLRYAPRFWRGAIEAAREGDVLIVTAKLWHVGKAVARSIGQVTGATALGYIFDEDEDLPVDLGNLEHGLAKRGRHRRALLNLILGQVGGSRLVFCLDPGRRDVIDDLVAASSGVRILAVERQVPDRHLESHARRTGLIGAQAGDFERAELGRALRHQFDTETAALARAHAGRVFRNDLTRGREANLLDIGHFLRCSRAEADAITREAERHAE